MLNVNSNLKLKTIVYTIDGKHNYLFNIHELNRDFDKCIITIGVAKILWIVEEIMVAITVIKHM